MTGLHLIVVAALMVPTAASGRVATTQTDAPAAAICADRAGWIEDGALRAEDRLADDFAAFDRQALAFSARLTHAFGTEGSAPDHNERAALRDSVNALRLALGRLLPASEPDNTGGPLMFSLDQLSGRNAAEDRQEVLRAAFVREMAEVSMPRPRPDISRFPAVLATAGDLLDRPPGAAIEAHDLGSLRFLADGTFAESYDIDFRRPALRVLGDRWHTGLASRLRHQVRRMCQEHAR